MQEEQANLLGELAMLRHYKHSHLVEFIGTAMAMERGSDTVREEASVATSRFVLLPCKEGPNYVPAVTCRDHFRKQTWLVEWHFP